MQRQGDHVKQIALPIDSTVIGLPMDTVLARVDSPKPITFPLVRGNGRDRSFLIEPINENPGTIAWGWVCLLANLILRKYDDT